MKFKEGSPLYTHEVQREGGEDVLYINYLGATYVPSLADSPEVMERTMDALIENPNVSRIVYVQQKNYNYDFKETVKMLEIAQLYVYFVKQEKALSQEKLVTVDQSLFTQRYNEIFSFLLLLKQDPIAAYSELKKLIIQGKIQVDKLSGNLRSDQRNYNLFLEKLMGLLEETKLIYSAKRYMEGYQRGNRDIYHRIFKPDIIPNFTFTRLVSDLPEEADIIDQYKISNGEYDESYVTILRSNDEPKYTYHIVPSEHTLKEDHNMLLNLARGVLIEHQPKAEEFTDTERTRHVFFNISKDLLQDLAKTKGIALSYSDLNKLATILVRHTIGFGLIEVLLQDPNLQDISLNAPIPRTPVFVRHQEYDECISNILPSQEDVDSWAAKFRMISGRPLDESNPILDTQLEIGKLRARIAIIQSPLSPDGLAYSIRRHRENPWTLPLFVKNGMINSLGAGLLSFLIDGSRTILVAGTRSSGKCVDGNTLIQLNDGRMEKIKNLIGKEKRKIDDGIIYETKEKVNTKSLKNMKMVDGKISNVWKRDSPTELIKIKTKSGKEIITTKEHPYFIYKSGLKNKRADELGVKDLIAVPRRLKVCSSEVKIDLANSKYLIDENKDFFILKAKTNSSTIKFPKKLTSEMAEFVGMVLGDGHLDLKKLEFHNSCKELRERYIFLLKMFNIKYRVFKSHTTMVVQVTSRVLNRVLKDVFEIPFGKKSDKIIIPKLILKSNNFILSRFLRGYFDCDGYVPKNKRDLELVTASVKMSEQMRLALLRFGITCFTKPKKIKGGSYYRILIRGKFVDNFARDIGFFHPMKKDRLNSLFGKETIENSNVDVISDGNEILKILRKKLRTRPIELRNFGKDYWAYESDQYRVTRNWFKKLVGFYKDKFDEISLFGGDVKELEQFINFDYNNYFEKIEKLRKLLMLSYGFLAIDSKLSEAGFRKILQQHKLKRIEILEEVFSMINKFSKRVGELSYLRDVNVGVESVNKFVNCGVVSYAKMSRELEIPESSLKFYCYGGINAPENLKILIENKLQEVKNELCLNLNEAVQILNKLQVFSSLFKGISKGVLISNLRNMLNISNEEFVSDEVSLTTVSNFFNGRHIPSVKVFNSIIKTITEKFNSVICDESKEFILEAEKLANSDIFWDEVISIENIKSEDDHVYDLSVEGTHNFVANGFIAHNTSLLGSLLLEIIPKFRIITVEDSLELPFESMRKLGYDILRMKVRAALLKTTAEVSAEDGIRTSLRLGDSCLIVGEVRSAEAKALYEAMRVGALANVVAGTIHGASPYGVFDRVVNDLGVPTTSFKATDIIVVCNPIKTPDGLHSWRRVVRISEIRKHWVKDPLLEKGFVDLMKYNVEKDELEATEDLINGDSEIIKGIASNIKGWAGNWDAVYDNILLRAKIKEEVVHVAEQEKDPDILESDFNKLSNHAFHRISDEVIQEHGLPLSEHVFPLWKKWLVEEIRKRKV